MSEAVIKTEKLTKQYKNKKAVDGISLSIKKGEIVAIVGPNGAGKSTLIRLMLGLLNPDSGKVSLFGMDPKALHVREKIGVMLQEPSLPDGVKVKELIKIFRSYYPQPLPAEEILRLTGLETAELNTRTEKLSGGQKRRVGFALALAGNPDLLFFDEPTVGMDVTARGVFWKTVKKLAAAGKTVLFSTHYLQEAEDAANRLIVFRKGQIIADGKPRNIKGNLLKQQVSFKTNTLFRKEKFLELAGVQEVYDKDGRTYITVEDAGSVLSVLFAELVDIQDIAVEKGRIEEVFEQLIAEQREAI